MHFHHRPSFSSGEQELPDSWKLGELSIQEVLPGHAAAKRRIDALLEEFLARHTNVVSRGLLRTALFPGRRLRPALLTHLVGLQGWAKTADDLDRIALAAELGHRASIILDDLIDGDELRRGERAFHVVHGRTATLLVSHQLVAEAFLQLSGLPSRVGAIAVPAFADTYRSMAMGELADIGIVFDRSAPAISYYEEQVLPKTAALFQFIFQMASTLARKSDAADFALLGNRIGRLYQVYNDVYDDLLAPGNARGAGRRPVPLSLLTCLVLDRGPEVHRRLMWNAINNRPSANRRSTVSEIQSLPQYRTAALDYASKLWEGTLASLDALRKDRDVAHSITAFAVWLRQKKCWDHGETNAAGY